MNPLFSARDISKRYGSVAVLNRVSFDVRGGEIHSLLGGNGAGKSTLCKIISGLVTASEGSMTLAGAAFLSGSKQAAEQAGVEIVQQELNLISTLTVAENILLTRMPQRGGIIRRRELDAQARRALDRFGLQDIATDMVLGSLGVGRQQMVEIATALNRKCRLLILDEPTAALSAGETQRLFDCLMELRGQGIGILYVSHRLDEVARMSDRVTVLRDGQVVCTRETSSTTIDQMIEMMSGEVATFNRNFRSFANEEPALEVVDISGGPVHDVSFSVNCGERLGITGLVGSGRTELLRLLFGAENAQSGTVRVRDGAPLRFKHPSEAVAAGLAMVTEDRKQNGLLLSQSIRSNTTICSLGKWFSSLGILRKARERRAASEMVAQLETKCNSIEQTVETLSGGNQQKTAISKWLVRDAEVFLFDEPTRGIDVSARRRIYRLLESLAKSGKAMVIVSSDLEELMETCDRIGVMSAGRWMGVFDRNSWTTEQIMQATFAGYKRPKVVA